ncbi:hypothetical protein HanRHA438_Chr14g0637261 [Helianthus annuus]|nr:hypothetical protein HanIR_Chr14g0679101 [Helianthus annuus]KAJ0852363.1 hypothetical protein HanRHA438_Chr14g0637261 [Helianthus annuus]
MDSRIIPQVMIQLISGSKLIVYEIKPRRAKEHPFSHAVYETRHIKYQILIHKLIGKPNCRRRSCHMTASQCIHGCPSCSGSTGGSRLDIMRGG